MQLLTAVFGLRNELIRDYEEYIKSFFTIRDERIRSAVEKHLAEGELWPDPLLQLNPSFQRGKTIDELVSEAVLHEECRGIFRFGKADGGAGTTTCSPLAPDPERALPTWCPSWITCSVKDLARASVPS